MKTAESIALKNTNMRCIVYGPGGMIAETTRPTPSRPSRDVIVQVQYASINPVDAKYVIGDKLPYSWNTAHDFVKRYLQDKIPGFDFSGIIAQDGHGFRKGDRVFGTVPPFVGTMAQYVTVPTHQLYYMPRNYSFAQAAALPLVGLTAIQCLQPHVAPSSNVLVVGASGGTGHVAMQVAKALGAATVTAVCSAKHADKCRQEWGADHVVDYNSNQFLEELESHAPYDIVMDCVTSGDPRDTSTLNYPKLLQNPAHHLLSEDYVYRRLGGYSPDWIKAGCFKMGINCWGKSPEQLFWIRFPHSAGELAQLKELAEQNVLTPHISKVYEFSAAGVREALEDLRSRKVQGKVVVQVANVPKK